MKPLQQHIHGLISDITPHDALEAEHRQDALDWVASGAPLFRIAKPDTPPKHLVSYFLLHDTVTNKLLLIDHVKSGLRLPAGGHVELDENPLTTVEREVEEELGTTAVFSTPFGQKPLFITVTQTVGQGQHTDVSLWYVIAGDSTQPLEFDRREMSGYSWLSPEEILATDITTLDPQLHRFVAKMHA